LYQKGIENDYLYETRLYCGNAILEILYSRLKTFCGDSITWVEKIV